jgi:hypothetical protein
MLEEIRKRPDELGSFEYLNEHLNEKVLKGGYKKEFRIVKAHIPYFKEFRSFRDLLEATKKDSCYTLKEEATRQLVELFQNRWDLRPSTGVVLVMVLWGRLVKIAPGGWFDSGVYWLLEEALCINPDDPGIVDSLIAVVRKKVHGKRFYDAQNGRRRVKERVVELEEDELEATDYLSCKDADYTDSTD